MIKYTLILVSIVCVLFFTYQAFRIYTYSRISLLLVKEMTAFSITPQNPTKRFLFIGDSLGVGVGARVPEESIAGRLSQEHPNAEIRNLSVSGFKIRDGLKVAQSLGKNDHYTSIFIQLGANDIVQLSNKQETLKNLSALLMIAKAHADKVIFYSAGVVGHAPIFIPPLNILYNIRSQNFFEGFQEVCNTLDVTYVDLYYSWEEDPFVKNPDLYYARDKFHVSSEAYAFWYEKIKKAL